MSLDPSQLAAWGRRGVELCRQGDWEEGVELLIKALAVGETTSGQKSSLFYSYLGYGIAKVKGRHREGIAFCEQAVKLEFFHAENQINLVRTYLLAGERKKAVAALHSGLKLDRGNPDLLALAAEIGARQPPVLGFLGRDNFLNVLLGRLRHGLSGGGKKGAAA